MKISFCTTCAQRLYQLEQVWGDNISNIAKHPNAEWVLLNYDGCEKMHDYVMSKQNEWPQNFTYAKEKSNRSWHIGLAKNIVHQLGSGKILYNLDCDNFIGSSVEKINELFIGNVKIMHFFSGIAYDGTCGRIAIDKNLFYCLGGYDESFHPMMGDDTDLMSRIKRLNFKIYTSTVPTEYAIKNSKTESLKLCENNGMTWEEFSRENKKKMRENLMSKQLVANQPQGMTKPNVDIYKRF